MLRWQWETRIPMTLVRSQPHPCPFSCRKKQLPFLLDAGNNSKSPDTASILPMLQPPDTEKAVYLSTHDASQFQPSTLYLFNPDQEEDLHYVRDAHREPLASFCECAESGFELHSPRISTSQCTAFIISMAG